MVALGLWEGQNTAAEHRMRPHVAELGAAAATFLIALSTPGPSLAELDNAR